MIDRDDDRVVVDLFDATKRTDETLGEPLPTWAKLASLLALALIAVAFSTVVIMFVATIRGALQ